MTVRYFNLVSTLLVALLATQAHSAEWKTCEKTKLRLLKLEQTQRNGNHKSSSKRSGRSTSSRQSTAELDEWLWKNCREYSNELRTLEQSRM